MLGGGSTRSGLSPRVKNGITAPKKTVVKTITPKDVVTISPRWGSCTCTTWKANKDADKRQLGKNGGWGLGIDR